MKGLYASIESIFSVFFFSFNFFAHFSIIRMRAIKQRARLVQQIKMQHSQIVERSATLELQQLRSFPMLNVALNQF